MLKCEMTIMLPRYNDSRTLALKYNICRSKVESLSLQTYGSSQLINV
jgi:hypothetical protein